MHDAGQTPTYVIALGGNAIIRQGEEGTIEQQAAHAREALEAVAALAAGGAHIVITHGNGPVVGNILLRNEAAAGSVSPMPLYIADADSAGGIGFLLQYTLLNLLREASLDRAVATLVTQVVVDPEDPAFAEPSKPVGPHYDAARAVELTREHSWLMTEVAPGIWRRVVASPLPTRIIETEVVRKLAESGDIVIAAGGGGIPVVEGPTGLITPVDAVVDKDFASALLARDLEADVLILLMEADALYRDWGTQDARPVDRISVSDARELLDSGNLSRGSIGPKLAACAQFAEETGRDALICASDRLADALAGRAGTRVTP